MPYAIRDTEKSAKLEGILQMDTYDLSTLNYEDKQTNSKSHNKCELLRSLLTEKARNR